MPDDAAAVEDDENWPQEQQVEGNAYGANRPAPPAANGAHELMPMRALDASVTTLVIRNLPAKYTRQEVLDVWPVDGTYDYMHLPYNLLQNRPLGYIFISFLSHDLAVAFQRRWQGEIFPSEGNRKLLDIGPAEVQGKRANLELLKSRKIGQLDRAGFLPVVVKMRNLTLLNSRGILAELARAGAIEQQRRDRRAAPVVPREVQQPQQIPAPMEPGFDDVPPRPDSPPRADSNASDDARTVAEHESQAQRGDSGSDAPATGSDDAPATTSDDVHATTTTTGSSGSRRYEDEAEHGSPRQKGDSGSDDAPTATTTTASGSRRHKSDTTPEAFEAEHEMQAHKGDSGSDDAAATSTPEGSQQSPEDVAGNLGIPADESRPEPVCPVYVPWFARE